MTIQTRGRKGAIAPLTAMMMTILVGLLAFAIDLGYVASVQGQLQNAADAAALAGAERLQNLYVLYYSPGQTQKSQIYQLATSDTTTATSPICTAQRLALANVAGNVHVSLLASDVSANYFDGTNPFTAPSYPNTFPNTITVTVRRDSQANGSLSLFFAGIFGMTSIDLTATASATIYPGDVTTLQAIPNVNAHILPVALDVNVWKTFCATGKSPDGNIYVGPDGRAQLQVYPFDTNTPGSFGLLDVGPPQNNAPAFRTWIDDGETPNDISYLCNNNLLPVSPAGPEPWKCGPGLKSTLLTDFQSVINEPNLIPLFVPASPQPNYVAASGNGQNATYAIVGFAGVAVSQATGTGSNMNISIQPCACCDPTAIINDASPARPSQPNHFSTPLSTFLPAKLTK
jgi:Flp pilus assembly protein TadG